MQSTGRMLCSTRGAKMGERDTLCYLVPVDLFLSSGTRYQVEPPATIWRDKTGEFLCFSYKYSTMNTSNTTRVAVATVQVPVESGAHNGDRRERRHCCIVIGSR
jgi:hypothetical protein